MKKSKSRSRKGARQGNAAGMTKAQGSSTAAQTPPPKWRPVFGQPLPRGFVPPTYDTKQAAAAADATAAKSAGGKSGGRLGVAATRRIPSAKANLASLPRYFDKMDPTERILLAYAAYKKPKGWYPESFYGYDLDSLRYLDRDLPDLPYVEIAKVLTKWTKLGILDMEEDNGPLSLADGVPHTFWHWLENKGVLFVVGIEPQHTYAADLPGTLDNLLTFLQWVDRGEALVTRSHEINKNSLKRISAAMTEPVQYPGLFTDERYFFWLLDLVQSLHLVRFYNGRLELTAAGQKIPQQANAAELLSQICKAKLKAVKTKGFFLVLPLLSMCNEWTSWSRLVTDLIAPAQDIGNLLRLDRVVGFLDLWRFLGLLDWGKYESDVLFRVTPLGEKMFLNLVLETQPDRLLEQIKPLADAVYPMSGPDTAYVQPNFEIMMPRSVSWKARWQLQQFAVLEQQDQMLKYRLDKTYLLEALKRGFPAGEVVPTLSRLSPYPLPENLVLTLNQWLESFGQVTFMQLVLLECTSAEQAATIVSARKYQDYVLGLYNPTTVIVREPEKLRKLLEKQGIYPLPGVLCDQEVAERKGLNPAGSSGTGEFKPSRK